MSFITTIYFLAGIPASILITHWFLCYEIKNWKAEILGDKEWAYFTRTALALFCVSLFFWPFLLFILTITRIIVPKLNKFAERIIKRVYGNKQ